MGLSVCPIKNCMTSFLAPLGVPTRSFLSFGKSHSQPETNLENGKVLGYNFNTVVWTLQCIREVIDAVDFNSALSKRRLVFS